MSESEVYSLLLSASSPHSTDQIKDVERRLSDLAESQDFYVNLASLSININLDAGARLQSLLYLKNAIDGVWRTDRRRPQGTSLDETHKERVRTLLLSHPNEPLCRLALQQAVLIAKIARYDVPEVWPQLMPTLTERIEHSELFSQEQQRALLVLRHAVKALASKRLASDKRNFMQLTELLFGPLCQLWDTQLSSLEMDARNVEQQHFTHSLLLCTKLLKQLLLYGFPQLKNEPFTAPAVVENLMQILPHRTALLLNTAEKDNATEYLHKAVGQILKLLLELHHLYVHCCAQWLPLFLQLTCGITLSDRVLPSKIRGRCLNWLTVVVLCPDYKLIKPVEQSSSLSPTDAQTLKASTAIKGFFTEERLKLLCGRLVGRHMVWSDEELQVWQETPETFAAECTEESDEHCWQFSLKPAACALYSGLVHEYWSELGTLMCEWLEFLPKTYDFGNQQAVLERDALLAALGLSADDLWDKVDFSQIFNCIVLDKSLWTTFDFSNCILQRRVLWLCAKWLGVKFDKALRPTLYQLLAQACSNSFNVTVRLTAADTIRTAVDDFEFTPEELSGELGAIVYWLVDLLQTCKEDTSRLRVVNCLVMLSQRVCLHLKDHLEPVISVLPSLWQSDHHLIKAQILSLLTHLTTGLQSTEPALLDGLCEILNAALDSKQSCHVYLLEDALELWLAMLENWPSPLDNRLLILLNYIPDLLTIQSENLKACIQIFDCYVTFGAPEFRNYLLAFGRTFDSLLEDLRSEAQVLLLKSLALLLRVYGEDAVRAFTNPLLWCLNNVCDGQSGLTKIVSLLNVASRVVLIDSQLLFDLVSHSNHSSVTSFVTVWLRKLPLVSHDMRSRKLNCLALTALVATRDKRVTVVLPDILSAITELMFDLCNVEDDGSVKDRIWTDVGDFTQSQHQQRRLALRLNDVLHGVQLSDAVRLALSLMPRPELTENTDAEVILALQRFRCL